MVAAFAARIADGIEAPWVKYTALAAIVASIWGHGWLKGANGVRDDWNAQIAQVEAEHLATVARLAVVREQVVYQYVDRYHTVYERGETIVKEVPKYISLESDRACVVPNGFVRVHDAAAANLLPGAASDTDGDPAGIALSTAAETIAGNYTACNRIREQLIALQAWIKDTRK